MVGTPAKKKVNTSISQSCQNKVSKVYMSVRDLTCNKNEDDDDDGDDDDGRFLADEDWESSRVSC